MNSIIYQILLEHTLTILGFLLAIYFIWRVLNEHRRPGGAIAWILIIIFAPYIGVPLYFILGKRKWVQKAHSKLPLYDSLKLTEKKSFVNPVERVLISAGAPPIRIADNVVFSFDGTDAFNKLIQLIDSATEYIYCTTFILGNDETGKPIIETLTRKAKEGINVYLLLDSLGCFYLPRRLLNPLIEAGGKVSFFLPILPLRRKWSANLRNHRKIVIVDGETAMVGGMNLSKNFMGPTPDPKRFLDCAVFLTGKPVKDIEEIFIRDWEFTTDEKILIPSTEFNETIQEQTYSLKSLIQVVASGPDVPEDTIYDAILTACMEAKERIWILTPYFVPDEPILKTLILQTRAGTDVSILLPKKSNHLTADYARGPALRELLNNGANIWFYPKGMIHAKLLIFDRFLAITGSPNLDIRSMYLNFEIALFHYSPMEIDCIAGWFSQLLNESEIIRKLNESKSQIFLENLSSLIAPLI